MARIRPMILLPPAIFAVLGALFFIGLGRDDPDGLPSALVGREAPPVQVTALPRGILPDDAALRADGVKLVNFWASWCPPCRAEHPQLEDIAAMGVPIHGINHKDRPDDALKFLDELGDPFVTLGADANGRMGIDWGVYGLPETFVVDGSGKVVLRFAGPITREVLQNTILPAIRAAESGG